MIPRLSDNISVIARSRELNADAVEIVVTLPTYKRPEWVLRTLASLKEQRTARKFAVIVIENEAEAREGAKAAEPVITSGEVPGMVIIAHERGNCSAYNAGWMTAFVHFPNFTHILVIDDDEMATPGWMESMVRAAEEFEADVVGAPQIQAFEDPANEVWSSHPVFQPPYKKSGRVDALYSSGNLLVARRVPETLGTPFLEPMFNFIGGGDSDFLSRAKQAGFSLAWCAEAPVRETVPARRVEKSWIRARGLRNGVISTLVEQRKRSSERFGEARTMAKSLALLAVSPFRALVQWVLSGSISTASYPVHVGLGRVMAHFGYANEQYRHAEKN
ncbi:MAG: glycosyltransferase family 2 protein [Rhizobiaceae bacterium]